MTLLLEFKEKLKTFYGKYSTYLLPILKFVLALLFFLNINSMLGFMEQLDNIFIVLVLALVCALLPINAMVVFGCLLIIGHCYAVGIEVALFAIMLLLLLLILYLRFAAQDAVGLLLTPIAFGLNVPCVIPMGYGLLRGPVSAFSSACGVIIYSFITLVQEKASILQGMESSEIAKKLQFLLDGLIQNQDMWITIIAFVAVVIIVYCLRRMSVNYAWQMAIVTGGVAYLMIMVGGSFFLDMNRSVLQICIQTVGSCLLMAILKFFVFHMDYSRTELLQYEDDDYYYYVKAVPKITITAQKRFIKTISEDQVPESKGIPVERKAKSVVPDPRKYEGTGLESKLEESLKDL